MEKVKEIIINMEEIDSDQYFCKGQKLSFDLAWKIYVVKGDLYIPYYRVYIGECLMQICGSLEKCYEYIKNLTPEAAHIAEM